MKRKNLMKNTDCLKYGTGIHSKEPKRITALFVNKFSH